MSEPQMIAEALAVLKRHLTHQGNAEEREPRQPEPWLSIEKAALHADVSPDTVRKWIAGGQLPYGRVGRVIRIRASSIDTMLLAARERLSGPPDADDEATHSRAGHILSSL